MKNINFKCFMLLFLCLTVVCCKDDQENDLYQTLEMSQTSLNFNNTAGNKSIEIQGVKEDIRAAVVSENSDWCTVKLTKDNNLATLSVSVTENNKIKGRRAQIELQQGEEKRNIIVLQTQKIFNSVAAVKNLTAESAPGAVHLTWEEPTEDNFSYVTVSVFTKDNTFIHSESLPKGSTHCTINQLISSQGEYLFQIRSFDFEKEAGEMVEVRCTPEKRIAFKFKDIPPMQYIGYYFKQENSLTSTLLIGSDEYNENETVNIHIETDPSLVDDFNQNNVSKIELMSENAYRLNDFQYDGNIDFQEMRLTVSTEGLEDRKTYAIPLKITYASGKDIEEEANKALLIYRVDDLEGWYTVERLPKCGEKESSYPVGQRRYIKRTGDYTWETGYLFGSYSTGEDNRNSTNTIQFITFDPGTKNLHIQQGDYQTSEDLNCFDPVSQELHIEYLYIEWAGWWTHERMYNRSSVR